MKNIFSIILFCVVFQGVSQNYFDIVSLTYINTPVNDFEISNGDTNVEELNVEVNFPVVLNKKTILLTGLFANRTKVGLDANLPSSNLQVLGLNIGINKTFNDVWSATFMAYPKIAADELKLSSDNLQVGFLSLFTKKKRSNLKYKYGAFLNTEKFGLLVLPIFGLYYLSPNKKFEANLTLPIKADVTYKLNEKFWMGFRFDGIGTSYSLNEQNYNNGGAYVSKASIEMAPYLRFKLSKSLYINTKFGYAFSRNYRVFNADDKIDLAVTSIYFGDDRTQLNENFADGAVFKIELLYRLNFN
ncbi:MAG: hypothetical protein ACJAVD_000719 [Porticoccaceae bacterium]|jgi:hypothetical protein